MELSTIPLSADAVEWLDELARRGGWVSANDVQPCECFRPLLWMGFVEQDDTSFRLTETGLFALTFYVEDVGE